jgi:hypothetical protein
MGSPEILESGMDAREPKPGFSRVERYAAALLAILIAAGLWQGYATWLLGAAHAV